MLIHLKVTAYIYDKILQISCYLTCKTRLKLLLRRNLQHSRNNYDSLGSYMPKPNVGNAQG